MPNLDGTGPMGKGRMTGRGLGVCNQALSRSRKIQHLPGEEDRYRLPVQAEKDVFVRKGNRNK